MFRYSYWEDVEKEAEVVFEEIKSKTFLNWWNSSIYNFKKPKES